MGRSTQPRRKTVHGDSAVAGSLAWSLPDHHRLQSKHVRRRHQGPARPAAHRWCGASGCARGQIGLGEWTHRMRLPVGIRACGRQQMARRVRLGARLPYSPMCDRHLPRSHAGCTVTSTWAPSLAPRVCMRRRLVRRRAGNAADQVDERRAVDGRDLAGQLGAEARGIVLDPSRRS